MRLAPLCLFAVLLPPAPAADSYLFASFRGNGEDGLHYALSSDGYHWTALADDSPWLRPAESGELMRDPFLTRAPDGIYHLLWTWTWYRDDHGLRLGHATSRDLVHWTEQAAIPILSNEPGARNAWAPEMSWDSKNGTWVIYWATTIPGRFPAGDAEGDGGLNHRIYSMTTRDFREYSPARVFFDPGFNVIDATIFPAAGRYMMVLKDERRNPVKKNLRLAFAKDLGGPYTGLTEPFTGDWVEGPTVAKIGDDYIVYFDHYARPQHYGAMRSRDLKTWEDVTAEMTFPPGQRHGTVIAISDQQAEVLRKAEPAAEPEPVFLWPNGAPGSGGKTEPEVHKLSPGGDHLITNVHRPAILPYLPAREMASGAAVIIAPGGGHEDLWMDHEGYNVGRWLMQHGIAGFVLKYRLARQKGSTYQIERESLADIRKALEVVRARAAEWNVDPNRIGVMGFSAGGQVAALAAMAPGDAGAARPAFQALIYPALPASPLLSKDTPPAFLVCGENDRPGIAQGIAELYLGLKRAGASAELHVYAGVGHGFGIRYTTKGAVVGWIERFHEFLETRKLLK